MFWYLLQCVFKGLRLLQKAGGCLAEAGQIPQETNGGNKNVLLQSNYKITAGAQVVNYLVLLLVENICFAEFHKTAQSV